MALRWHETSKAEERWIAIKTWRTPKSGQALALYGGFGCCDEGLGPGPRMFSRIGRCRYFTRDRTLHQAVREINNRYGTQIPMPQVLNFVQN